MEEEDGKNDGGEGFEGSDDGGFRRFDIGHTVEVESEGKDCAEEDYITEGAKGFPVQGSCKGSEKGNKAHDYGGDQHAPSYDGRGTVFLNDGYGSDGINGAGKGGEKSPEKGEGRNGKGREVSCRGDQGSPCDGKNGTSHFYSSGMAFFPETGPEYDEDRHEVLKNRGCRRIAVTDGCKVTVLGPQHAQGAKNEEGQPVFPFFPDGPYIFLEEICREDEDQS